MSERGPLAFTAHTVTDEARLWWATAIADVNADGRTDVVMQHDNGYGGWLGWYESRSTWPQMVPL